ncbi:MAG TPA: FecR family protein [Caulobacteraceae bacterium]|nr:FecR family protein [Caulobacteraceae bacterium]
MIAEPPKLAQEAADWDIRLRSPACTAADRAAFEAWCTADPAHAEAFEGLQVGLSALKDAYASSPRLRAMRDRARSAPPQRASWRIAASLAVALVGGGAVAGYVYTQQPPGGGALATMELPRGAPSVHQTAVGERTTVTLSDGSVVTLNTRSRVVVSYTAERREVTLVAGQALFEVARNAARPFVVTAGSRQVTALGTAFDVRLDRKEVRVTLIEGKVKVEPAKGSLWRALPLGARNLAPGQQLVASNASPTATVTAADLPTETSWKQGVVVFNDTPLAEAVAEINRYSAEPITVGDPALGALRINGRFRTSEPNAFLNAVTAYFPVEAQRTPSGETVLNARS